MTFLMVRNFKLYRSRVLNGTVHELTNVLYEELKIGNDTTEEQALWSYFRDKQYNVYLRYLELRDNGIEILRKDSFLEDLFGFASDLQRYYPFSKSLCEKVELLNKKCFGQFVDYMNSDMRNVKNKNDYYIILKNNTIQCFRKNVKLILRYWRSEKQIYSFIGSNEISVYNNSVSIHRKQLKKMLEKGENGIGKVLDVLDTFLGDDYKNVVVQMKAKYSDYKKKKLFDIEENTEVNKLRMCILDLIDSI